MKSGFPNQTRMLLRGWAGKIEQGTLPQDEAREVAKILRLLADGRTVFEIFGIKKINNRPRSGMVEQRIREAVVLQRRREEGGEGLDVGQAIARAAAMEPKISKQSVTAAYYGNFGKQIRASMDSDLELARELLTSGVWRPL